MSSKRNNQKVHPYCSYLRYTAHSFWIHRRRYSGTHQFLALASKATNWKFSLRRFINSTRMGSNSSTLRRWTISINYPSDVRQRFEILPFLFLSCFLEKLTSSSYAAMLHFDVLENSNPLVRIDFVSNCKMLFFNETSTSWTTFLWTFTEKGVEALRQIP